MKKNYSISTLTLLTLYMIGTHYAPILSAADLNRKINARKAVRARLTKPNEPKHTLDHPHIIPAAVEPIDKTETDVEKDEEEEDEEKAETTEAVRAPHTPQPRPAAMSPAAQRVTPSTWSLIYNLLPQIILQSFSTGSEAGIGDFTKTMLDRLLAKRAIAIEKKQFEAQVKSMGLSDFTQDLYLLNKSPQQIQKLSPEEQQYINILSKLQKKSAAIQQAEQQTSARSIFGQATSTALISTAANAMGGLMIITFRLFLQLLAPQKQ